MNKIVKVTTKEEMERSMNQNEFALNVQVKLARDLKLPQYSSLQTCRDNVELIVQSFEDGFSPEETVSFVKQQLGDVELVKDEAKLAASFW